MKMSSPAGVALPNASRPVASGGQPSVAQSGNPQIGRLEQKFNQKGFIPPGIAKKIPPRPVNPQNQLGLAQQNQQQPVGGAPQITPQGIPQQVSLGQPRPLAPVSGQAVLGQPILGQPILGQPVFGLSNIQQQNLIQAGLQPPDQAVPIPQAIPQLGAGFGAGVLNPINPNPPAILSGVSEAFATGNPLAGPLQLVNNINANALNTVRAAGLL
jgi:hypothetical protein